MRILYGVVGEGMGHATRSKVIIEHLAARHELELAASGRARGFLEEAFPALSVHAIHGLTMVYEDNRVRKAKTAMAVVKGGLPGARRNLALMARLAEEFRPELCIADFDSFAWTYARRHRVPVFSIDNMQVIDRCRHTLPVPASHRSSYGLARALVKSKLQGCDHYFITSFFFPEVRKPRTSLHPPILRQAILDARGNARQGDHVLVYQTSDGFSALVPTLRALSHRFVVYGLKRDEEQGNVVLRSFSEQGFVDDLASAAAVIAGGGFSLLGEAIYLGKPVYAVPLQGQFEQVLNALYLQELGYGEHHDDLSAASIGRFLERSDGYRDRLAAYHQDGNRQILAELDARIAGIAGATAQAPGR